ncbi:MAG TPA: DUF2380 domain-containing protein [Bradyrhizobium sp.]|uniref:DUF2380 domain-containing protein n=1 Tax=Bradyrhizobium sp. TaxID=376 RepID=UPI002BF13915|nr:DUF2380 domain-containing protein [Bradyrhizobium sp.]HLZ06829.1 DUF2380 domain-containing protein [Bradyrhizobium sp.]
MYHSCLARSIVAAGLFLGCGLTTAWSGTPAARTVAIDDFSYLDTSHEPADQTAAHQKRLQAFMAALRDDVTGDARFHLVTSSCAPNCAANGSPPAQRLRAASQDGAQVLIVGAVQKTSTLVQWARAAAVDVASNRVVYERIFAFRGDNDESWQRAEAFISEQIRSALADSPTPAAAAAPIKLAVFPFGLEDMSAAAGSTGETASDAGELDNTTAAVRRLLAQSGRYQVIDAGAAGADAVKARTIRDCGGCDAQIALALDAEQSLVGVIRRVSRTEYTVRFQIHNIRNGAVVANADSGLRMGANYSWSRGAARLVRDRLLHDSPPY